MKYTRENYYDLKIQEFKNLSLDGKKYISINKTLILLDLLKQDLIAKEYFDDQEYEFVKFLRNSLMHGVQMNSIKALSNMYRFDVIDKLLYIDYYISEKIEMQSILIKSLESNLALSCREDCDKWMVPYNKFSKYRFNLRIDITKFIEEVKSRLGFNVKEEFSETVDNYSFVYNSLDVKSRLEVNVEKEFSEVIDNHSLVCGSSNELIYLKFAIKEYLKYSYDSSFSGLTESIILSSPILYDYVFRNDTKTGVKYNVKYALEDKIAYKLIRNLIVHERTILDHSNFKILVLENKVKYEFDELPDNIFNTELFKVNRKYIYVKNNTIVINIKKVFYLVNNLITKLMNSIIEKCSVAIHADKTEEEVLEKEKQLILKLLDRDVRAKQFLDHVYKTIYAECTRFVLELLYFIFICNKLIEKNIENKKAIIRFIDGYFEYSSEYQPEDHCYAGNAYNLLSYNEKSVCSELINFVKEYDCIFETEFADEFISYLNEYDIELEEYSGIDLYKNILITKLVIYDLKTKCIIIG